jgi:hypothetical protein
MKKIFLTLFILLSLGACASYTPSIQNNFVKVLGVTAEGDTILIDVNSLRPKVYNNYYYDTWNRYPYNNYYWNPPVIIQTPKPKPNRPNISRPVNRPTKPIVTPNITKDKQ